MGLAVSPYHRVLGLVLIATLAGGCKGSVDEGQIISDAKKYLALADSGDPEAYQRLSSSAKKHITEAAFVERMKPEPGVQIERRNIEVVGAWEKTALVQYEIKSGSGPWETENGFYTREVGGWMRAFTRQLRAEGSDADREATMRRIIEVEPDPVSYLGLCSLYLNRDKAAAVDACRMVVGVGTHFPTRRFQELRMLAHLMLAGVAESDWQAAVKETSSALDVMDKDPALDRKPEASLRFIRLVTLMQHAKLDPKNLTASEWQTVGLDWSKVRATCDAGSCGSLRERVQSVAAEMDAAMALRPVDLPPPNAQDSRFLISDRSHGFGYIDGNGKVVIEPQISHARVFSEGLAAVEVRGKWGYIDKMGKIVIEPQFNEAKEFSEGLAPIYINDFENVRGWGFIDKAGKIVVKPRFREVDSFHDGLALVREDDMGTPGKAGYIDKDGKFVIPLSWRRGACCTNPADLKKSPYARVRSKQQWPTTSSRLTEKRPT